MEEIKKEIKICIETSENENNNPKSMGFSKNSAKENVNCNTSLCQETRENSNNLTLHLKQLEKRRNGEFQS